MTEKTKFVSPEIDMEVLKRSTVEQLDDLAKAVMPHIAAYRAGTDQGAIAKFCYECAAEMLRHSRLLTQWDPEKPTQGWASEFWERNSDLLK